MHLRSVLPLSVAALMFFGGCDSAVETHLAEAQANEVIVALHGQGIGATKAPSDGRGGEALYDVRVPSAEVGHALAVLSAAGLPRVHDPGIHEIFSEGGLVPTATEERARYVAALSGELSQSIERIDGVLDARVHLAIPDRRVLTLDEERPTPRASVLIKHRAGPPPFDTTAIQTLVAGAVGEMQPEMVSVVAVAAPALEASGASLVRVGPISVARGSAMMLKIVLVSALAALMVLVMLLAWAMTRRARA